MSGDSNFTWRVMSNVGEVGVISSNGFDQPWFICRFTPGESWGFVCRLFEEQSKARDAGFPEEMAGALRAVIELDLELIPAGGGKSLKPMLLYIDGESAKFRPKYSH